MIALHELRRFRLLADHLSTEDLAVLAESASVRHAPRGTLILAGESNQFVSLVARGWVRLYRIDREGRQAGLALRGPGELLASPVDGATDNLYAEAIGMTRIMTVPRAIVRELMTRNGRFAVAVLDHMARRTVALERHVESMVDRRADRRIVDLVEELSAHRRHRPTRVPLRLTHHQLASLVGVTRESLTVALNRLIQSGVLVSQEDGPVALRAGARGATTYALRERVGSESCADSLGA